MKTKKNVLGYDILGNIAIVDLKSAGKSKERGIARKILEEHKSVETVLAKAGPVRGKYRTRKLRYILGKRNYIADYRENGCRFLFDVRKSFFSNRLSFERARISALSKKKENTVVMFAGVGPFAIEIAKRNPKANVVAIELNKEAFASMCENIMINKTPNVTAVLGDVKDVAQRYKRFADRVIMPLPMSSADFIEDAIAVSKKRAVIHIYSIGPAATVMIDTLQLLKAHAKKMGYSATIISSRVVRNYSPREVETCVDAKLSRL